MPKCLRDIKSSPFLLMLALANRITRIGRAVASKENAILVPYATACILSGRGRESKQKKQWLRFSGEPRAGSFWKGEKKSFSTRTEKVSLTPRGALPRDASSESASKSAGFAS
jgi:hypothetical protein